MRQAAPIFAVSNSDDQPSAASAEAGSRSGRHRGSAGRRPWRTAIAGLALIISGLLIAGPVSATPAGTAGAAPTAAPAPGLSMAGAAEPRLAAVVRHAMSAIAQHVPYSYGGGHGATPSLAGGADCSGFIRWAYYQAFGADIGSGSGDSMIRTSGKFTRVATPVPGDVALFGNGGSAPAYHAGIYIGLQNGRAAMAAEVQTGETARIQYVYGELIGYYRYRGAGAADLPQPKPTKAVTTVGVAVTAATVRPGQTSTVRIAVRTAGGSLVSGAKVKLYQRSAGRDYLLAAQVTTDGGGNATVRVVGNGIGHQFMVRFAGDTRYLAADSAAVTQSSGSSLAATAGVSGMLRKSQVSKMTGITSAGLAGSKVQLQRITSQGWQPTGGASIVGQDGRFGIYWRVGDAGYYRLAIAAQPSRFAAAVASPTYAIVTR